MIPSPFVDPLPPVVDRKLRAVKLPEESIYIQVVTDMAEDLTFGERWLIVTDRRALLLSSDGEDGTIDLLLRDITAARLEQSVGGGCLALERTGCATILLGFSNSLVPKFAKVAEGIRQLCIGESPSLPTTMERSRCPQCGRLLPERNGSCPSCVKKLDTLRRIAGCLRPYWGKVALLVPIMATGALAEILPPVITQRIIDDALKPRADYTLLIWLVLGFLGVRFLGCVCEIGQRWLSIWLGSRMIADLRGQYYCHLQHLSLRFYNRSQLGMLLSRAIHDAGRLEEFLVQGLPSALTYGLMVGGILGLLFYENWVLTLYILLPIPPILLGTRLIWGRLMHDWGRVSTNWSGLFTHLSESISGIRVVKAFAQEGRKDAFRSPERRAPPGERRSRTNVADVFPVCSVYNCTFPENTEPAATGQGIVSADFRRRQVSGPAGPGEDRRGKPPARWTVCLRPNGSSDRPESSEE